MAEKSGDHVPGRKGDENTLPVGTILARGADQQTLIAQPALTIQIRSWATPIVGILTLVVGLLAGYFLRPILDPLVVQAPSTGASATTATSQPPTEDQVARREALMSAVLPRVRHFRGDEEAAITLIEFGDFQ